MREESELGGNDQGGREKICLMEEAEWYEVDFREVCFLQ